ncbi:Loquacious [Gryllus bimaculatus]|nr:Loquacious [Gryllus bimaculatus]
MFKEPVSLYFSNPTYLNSSFRYSEALDSAEIFGSDHPKTENNHVAMWSLLTEIDIGNSGDYTPSVQSNNLVSEVQVISQSPDNVLRHPVTLLHQICSDLKWPSPTYVVISEDVTATRHVFTLECKVLKHKASGVGLSKRKAKRSASMALLEKLNENEDLGKYAEIIYSHMYIFDKESETECPSEDGGAGNATSELYKMCYARRWPLPVYGLLSMEGPVHNRLYRIGCTMPGFQELDEASHYFAAEGKGHTKKEAKHAASVALLDKILGDMSSNPTSSCTTNSFEDRARRVPRTNYVATNHGGQPFDRECSKFLPLDWPSGANPLPSTSLRAVLRLSSREIEGSAAGKTPCPVATLGGQ